MTTEPARKTSGAFVPGDAAGASATSRPIAPSWASGATNHRRSPAAAWPQPQTISDRRNAPRGLMSLGGGRSLRTGGGFGTGLSRSSAPPSAGVGRLRFSDQLAVEQFLAVAPADGNHLVALA
jgi:hypothetical protein